MQRLLNPTLKHLPFNEKILFSSKGSLSALNIVGIGISIIDKGMRILWANEVQSRILTPPENLLGKHCYRVYRRHRGICENCPAKKSLQTGKSHSSEMAVIINGVRKYFLVTANPIKDRHSRVLYIVKTVQDITLIERREEKEISLIKKLSHTNQGLNSLNKKIALLNNSLKRKVFAKTRNLRNLNKNLDAAISTLVTTLEAKDPFTQGHSDRVTRYSICIAKKLGLPEKEMKTIRCATKLHDIGKIAISDSILNKPGPLSVTEKTLVQMHTLKGAEMLANIKFLEPGINLIKYHHERYDGNGYPEGLKKNHIPITARIVNLADAFDAMTSDRPYRKKLSIEESVEEIKKCSGSQFDPDIVAAFLDILGKDALNAGPAMCS